MVLVCRVVCPFRGGVPSCPLGAGGRLLWLVLCFRAVFPTFCPLSCFMLVVLLANMALFGVLRAFIWVYRLFARVCIGCVLCVACGAFVCVSG